MTRLRQSSLCNVMIISTMIVVAGCLVTDAIHPDYVDKQINVFLLGRAGAGKSTVGNAFVEALLNWTSEDFTFDTPQKWTRKWGSWEQCDCLWCHTDCPLFELSPSTSSCTNDVLASTVLWAQCSHAHMYADNLPTGSEEDHKVTGIQPFDTPGMPDTDPDRMSEYYDKIVRQMIEVGRVDAIVWVQSDGRVDAADRGLRVLLKQFNVFPGKVLLVNGKGHYRRSNTKGGRKQKLTQLDKEGYRNSLLADWAVENTVGLGWHGQMFVSVDQEDLEENVMPKVISYILALSASRKASHVADPTKLKTLTELWHDLVAEFLKITSSKKYSKKLIRDTKWRLSQINSEMIEYEKFESFAANSGRWVKQVFGIFGHILSAFGAWLSQAQFERGRQLRAAQESLQVDIRNLEIGNLQGIQYITERAGEIRDLCALLTKPDCPDVGAFVRDPPKREGYQEWPQIAS